MTTYFFLMNDGTTCSVESSDKVQSFAAAAEKLGYDQDLELLGFDQFLDNVNLCEWKDEFGRYVQDCTQKNSITTFPADSGYQIEKITNKRI